VERNHPKSNWGEYFYSIRQECPWSYAAWQRGQIDIAQWEGNIIPLGEFQARMYIVDASGKTVEAMAQELDEGEYEWLFSYPGYGQNSTPEFVLIQQDRATLTKLREKAK
jgi:hypothetical protein